MGPVAAPLSPPVHAPRVTPGDFSFSRTAGDDAGVEVCRRCGWDRNTHQMLNACVDFNSEADPTLFQRNIDSLELQATEIQARANTSKRRR